MAGYDEHSISVLEGLEAVRKRPGMYIGSVSRKGLNHLIYEIVDNSVDEHLAGACDTIHVTLEKNGSCTVEDNGRGVPVGMHAKGVSAARLVYTTLHAGGKFDDSAYKTSGGLHGVGSSVVNALSVYMDVEISREGYIHHDRYERGVPVVELENGLLPKIGKTKKTGTKVNFLPDPEIFEKTRFKEDEIKSRMHETAYLNPKLTIIYEDRRGEEVEHIVYHEEDGIRGFVKDLNKNTEVLHDVVYFKGESEGITVEAAFQYTNEFHENILGFCNNIFNAEGGTHITGFKTVFTTVINSYARELGILKEKDVNFTGADVRNGMTAVVSIKHPDPRFEGQTKTKLDNQDAAKATAKVTGDEIQLFFDKNLETLKTVISCAETIFVTHDLGVVARVADRVAVMYAGKIVELGTTEDIFYDARHPYTWGLMQALPAYAKGKEMLHAIPGMPPVLIDPPRGDAFACRNEYALAIDYEKEPPMFRISDTHHAATWLLDERAPEIKPPSLVCSSFLAEGDQREGCEETAERKKTSMVEECQNDAENRETLVAVNHLTKSFSIGKRTVHKAVDDVSFRIYKGEVFGLVGESGSGKIKKCFSVSGRLFFRIPLPV